VRALVAGVALGVAIAACAQGSPRPVTWPRDLDKKNEITTLWAQIRDWRREAHMDVEPPEPLILALRSKTVHQARASACPDAHVVPPTCTDVCDLADAICDNAESICGIASEMPEDGWAREKCDSAKASCKEAKQACCGCDDAGTGAEVAP